MGTLTVRHVLLVLCLQTIVAVMLLLLFSSNPIGVADSPEPEIVNMENESSAANASREKPRRNILTSAGGLYRSEFDIDDWQPVIYNICYAYSAYLDPDSNKSLSTAWILGSLRQAELLGENNLTLHCVLWIWESGDVPKIVVAPVYYLYSVAGIRE